MTTSSAEPEFVTHDLIKPNVVERRLYQDNIVGTCRDKSALVVLPTGMGKTVIALQVIAARLQEDWQKAIFLAPTKPLVEQHAASLRLMTTIDTDDIVVFTGETPPKKRKDLFESARVICSTPQVIQNDLIADRLDLSEVSVIIFDEAHRAVGNYAYVFIAERYRELELNPETGGHSKGPTGTDSAARRRRSFTGTQTLGITASPGADSKKVLEVCGNLAIDHVEIRSEFDPDVKPYVHKISVDWVEVPLPKQVKRITDILREVYEQLLKRLQSFGLIRKSNQISKKELLDAQRKIQMRIRESRNPPKSIFNAAVYQSMAMKVNHAMELAETQGIFGLNDYFQRLEKEAHSRGASRGSKMLYNNDQIKQARLMAARLEDDEHPKLEKITEIIARQFNLKYDSRIIVFTHFRDTSQLVTDKLSLLDDVRPVRFVGQASRGEDKGINQKQQVAIIEDFKQGKYNVLVATSVAEEGLDIPATDLVIFYEPVPSEIRTIQRRGRTGRKRPGRVIILITKGTRDVAYYWSSRGKERKMKATLEKLKKDLAQQLIVDNSLRYRPASELKQAVERPEESSRSDQLMGSHSGSHSQSAAQLSGPSVNNGASEPIIASETLKPSEKVADTADDRSARQNYEKWKETAPQLNKKGQTNLLDFKKTGEQTEDGASQPNATVREFPEKGTVGSNKDLVIYVDNREFNSGVVRELSRAGAKIVAESFDAADYILSQRMGVERKEVKDFLSSLLDGRLFPQVRNLTSNFTAPLLIIEGEEMLVQRNISANAIYGALASLITDFHVSLVQTRDERETADVLLALARRESKEGKEFGLRPSSAAMTPREQQKFIVEGLPNISVVNAQRLLEHFGSVREIYGASEEELMAVKGIGKKTAREIIGLLDREWEV